MLSRFSCVWFFVTLSPVAHKAPLFRDSPGKNTGRGCRCRLKMYVDTGNFSFSSSAFWVFNRWLSGKESTSQYKRCRRHRFPDSWVGKIPWGWKWQPTPVFLPGESHGQRSLLGYSQQGREESDTTEHICTHTQPAFFLVMDQLVGTNTI